MRTSRNPCFLRWRWIVLCRNVGTFLVVLGGVVYGEQARGKTRGDWRDRGWHADGREQKRIPLCGRAESGRVGDESLWLHFSETIFEQHRSGERDSAFRQGRGRQQSERKPRGYSIAPAGWRRPRVWARGL